MPGLIIFVLNTSPLVMLVLLPTSIFFEIDAGYFATKLFMNSNSYMGLLLRYVTLQWAVVEGARTYSFWLSIVVGVVTSTRNIVRGIRMEKLSFTQLNNYRKLQIVTQAMRQVTSILHGILMAAGFFLAVFLNFLLITCRHSIPAQVYVFVSLLTCCLYLIILLTIPIGVDAYTWSQDLVRRIWFQKLVSEKSSCSKYEGRIMRKWIFAQNHVAFSYGIAIFDEETRRNYNWNILIYTINLILVR